MEIQRIGHLVTILSIIYIFSYQPFKDTFINQKSIILKTRTN